jgi:hypothetical protein
LSQPQKIGPTRSMRLWRRRSRCRRLWRSRGCWRWHGYRGRWRSRRWRRRPRMGIRTDDDHFSARNRSSRKRIRAWRLVIGDGMEGETCPTHLLIRILGEPTAALRRTRELEVESHEWLLHAVNAQQGCKCDWSKVEWLTKEQRSAKRARVSREVRELRGGGSDLAPESRHRRRTPRIVVNASSSRRRGRPLMKRGAHSSGPRGGASRGCLLDRGVPKLRGPRHRHRPTRGVMCVCTVRTQ